MSTSSENNLVVAYNRLLDEVRHAFDAAGQDNGPTQARYRYILGLLAVAKFLENTGAPRHYCDTFAELGTALSDLDQGTVNPVLWHANTGTRPPDASKMWRDRACVCIGLNVIVATGKTRSEAAEYLAKKYGKRLAGLMTRKSSSLVSAILSWDDEFKQGRVKNREAGAVYERNIEGFRQDIASHSPGSQMQRVEQLLELFGFSPSS
jgi:hypothetical protein